MSDWVFTVDDSDPVSFSFEKPGASALRGRYLDITRAGVRVVGGMLEIEPGGANPSCALVSLSNGHVARFDPVADDPGTLQYVGIV